MKFESSCLCNVRDTAKAYGDFLDTLINILKSKPEANFDNKLTSDEHIRLTSGDFAKTEKEFEAILEPALILKNSFISFARKFSIEYNYAVIGGEYYFGYVDEAVKEIDFENKRIAEYYSILFDLVTEEFRSELNALKNITQDVIDFQKLFQRLSHFVKAVLEFRKDSVFIIAWHEDFLTDIEIDDIILGRYLIEYNKPLSKYFKLYKINLKVAYIEDNIRCSEKQIYDLYKIKRWLELETDSLYLPYKVLTDKCDFLIKKVALGMRGQSKTIYDDTKFLEKQSEKIKPIDLKIDEFSQFDQKLQWYYNSFAFNSNLIYDNEAFEIERKIKSEKTEDVKYSDLHYLSKVYLQNIDTIGDVVSKFDKLVEFFHNRFNNIHNGTDSDVFNKQAFLTTKLFFLNRKLEMLFEVAKRNIKASKPESLKTVLTTEIDVLEKYLKEIQSEQINGIRNYFAFFTISRFYNFVFKYLEDNKLEQHVTFEQIGKVIKQFTRNFNLAYENLKWCDERDYLQLYLPYSECITPVKKDKESSQTFNAFLDSAYIIPVDYESCWARLNKLKDYFLETRIVLINNLLTFKTRSISENYQKTIELQKRAESLTSSLHTLKEKIEPLLTQSIQILGIFSGIIAFAFGSINTIPRFKCGEGILLFLIALGAILLGFIWFINYIVLDKRESKKGFWNKRSISGLSILLVLVICSLFASNLNDCGLNNDTDKSGMHNSINFQPNNNQEQQIVDTVNYNQPKPRGNLHFRNPRKNPCDSTKLIDK